MAALDDLQEAAGRLEAVRIELDTALAAINFRQRERDALGALGAGVVTCAQHQLPQAVIDDHNAGVATFLTTAPQSAVMLQASEQNPGDPMAALEALSQSFSQEEIERSLAAMGASIEASRGPHARLLLAFQSMLYSVRALQDSFYRVGLVLADWKGQPYAPRASMSSAIGKPANPVRLLLGDFADEYLSWFEGWRNIRNSVKSGRSASIVGPAFGSPPDDYGISLDDVDGNGGLIVNVSAGTRISDVTTAINMSTRVAEILTTAAKDLAPPPNGPQS